MKIKSPEIYVISKPYFNEKELRRFLEANGLKWKMDESAQPGEHIVEISGRVCYMSFTDDTSKVRFPNSNYISNLISRGHESVLEHSVWTFILDGVSRSFTHQLVRHRVGFSYSQLSQQYHDESEAEMVLPNGLHNAHPAFAAWEQAVDKMLSAYKSLVGMSLHGGPEDGRERLRWIRSVARSLLPNATATTIAVTANARALRHFLNLRGAIEGDYEMREISVRLLKAIGPDAPALFSDFDIVTHHDGHEMVVKTS